MKSNAEGHNIAIQEFNHRIANSLTLLIAGLNRDFAEFESPNLRAALRRHQIQIVNIWTLHRLLASEPDTVECAIASYFEPFCSALARLVLTPINIECEVCLAEGVLPGEKCARVAQIISELVMNAAKHAFSDNDDGRVRISIFFEAAVCRCIVSDNGIGLRPGHPGQGSKIVNALAAELDGYVFTQSGFWGTAVSVVFPFRPA